jgi:ATP-dependent DNA ligase
MGDVTHADLMLATLHRRPFSDPAWIFEIKYDGFRCLVRKTGEQVDLISRNGKPLNGSFPEIVESVSRVPGDFAWDAELTVDDASGRSSFERLQRRAVTKSAKNVPAAAKTDPARLYVFDALSIDRVDLRGLPLSERKERLREAFDDTKMLIYASGVISAGEWVFEHAKSLDLEGMVAKRLSSTYQRGRSHDWLKIKHAGYSRPAALGFGKK